MRLITLFFLTHLAVAAVALAAFGAAESSSGTATWLLAAAGLLLALGGAAWWLARWCRGGLRALEAVVRAAGEGPSRTTGIAEFDRAAERIAEHAERLDELAANSQQQARELQAILMVLDRRGGGKDASSRQLRRVLASLGGGLHSLLRQMQQNTLEVGQATQEIAEGAEAQGSAVIKTSTYIEQLSAHIGDVSEHAEAVQTGITSTRQSASEALEHVRQLAQGIERIRVHSESSEKKLRRLADPSRQISSIVETIGDIAARTDLLALNASIESIRAGEHGRGFAVVADEVRKLAEQASQATREITGLIDSMQMETQESIAAIARERSEAESEVRLASTTEEVLEQIRTRSDSHASRAQEIARAAHQQLQLTQEVVLAMEQVSSVAKSSRRCADSAQWSMKSLSQTTGRLDDGIERLRSCGETRHWSNRDPSSEDRAADADPAEASREDASPREASRGAPSQNASSGDRSTGGEPAAAASAGAASAAAASAGAASAGAASAGAPTTAAPSAGAASAGLPVPGVSNVGPIG